MKKKSKKPMAHRVSQKEKEFETLLQRAVEVINSKKKTERKLAQRLAR